MIGPVVVNAVIGTVRVVDVAGTTNEVIDARDAFAMVTVITLEDAVLP